MFCLGSLPAPALVAPVQGGNALTLPSQRHVVRVAVEGASPVLFLALQQGLRDARGLGLYRSDDEGATWRHAAAIQPDAAHPDRADLLAVGNDVALVYSVETPDSQPITGSPQHDVKFQWWRHQEADHTWVSSPPVTVFNSSSTTTAFYRAELARDSLGRLWVQAFKLEADGTATVVISVSTDGGLTFTPQPALDKGLPNRGGGRLLSLGARMLMLYDTHGWGYPAKFRMREDSAALGTWLPAQTAFPEGIYHGAALSAVADGKEGFHLVYKDDNEMKLFYRHFNGDAFGERVVVEEAPDWALQPATTRVGDELRIFYNSVVEKDLHYEVRMRRLRDGVLGPVEVVDDSRGFKAYLSAPETVPRNVPAPCAFGMTPDPSREGQVVVARWQAEPILDGELTSLPADDEGGVPAADVLPQGERMQMTTAGCSSGPDILVGWGGLAAAWILMLGMRRRVPATSFRGRRRQGRRSNGRGG